MAQLTAGKFAAAEEEAARDGVAADPTLPAVPSWSPIARLGDASSSGRSVSGGCSGAGVGGGVAGVALGGPTPACPAV